MLATNHIHLDLNHSVREFQILEEIQGKENYHLIIYFLQ